LARRLKKKDHENLSDTNIRKVIELLSGQAPISKKEACSILNIAYNTTRLQRIIDDFEETQAYRSKRKLQNKGKAATKDEVADAVTRFLSGDPISEIASGLYRSSGFIKAIIERVGVPQKQEGTYDYLPEECVAEDFTVGEIVWSAKYHGPAIIRAELSVDYQAERAGYRDVNYEKKYGTKAYNIWVIEKVDDDYSDRWTTSTGGGFSSTQLAYDLGKLSHLKEYGVDLSRI
jgi:AraC-like DNA-binding protein